MEKIESSETFQTFALSEVQATKILSNAKCKFPDHTVRKFEEGMVNDVFAIGDQYVVKVNTGHPDQPKLKREKDVMHAMKGAGVPTPHVYLYDDSKLVLQYPYLLMEFVEGQTLSTHISNMSEDEKRDAVRKMGNTLGRIHSFDHTSDEYLNTPEWTEIETISERVADLLPELRATNLLIDEELGRVSDFFVRSERFGNTDAQYSVLHGNFAPSNIIMNEGAVSGVIDWEWAHGGIAEEELAVTLYRGLPDKSLSTAFLEGYAHARSVSDSFEQDYHAFALLYFLKVLPEVPKWIHKPEKQEEYISEAKTLIKKLNE